MAYLSEADGLRALQWAFAHWGRAWGASQSQVWPLYFLAATARRDGDRDYAAEEQLFALMRLHEQPRAVGERRLAVGVDVFGVMPVAGYVTPTYILSKNDTCYGLVQVLPMGLRCVGAINIGAEPLDPQLARDVFFHAA